MRKFLLFVLMLSGLMTSAQTSISDGNCKAQFKYVVNDKIMTLVPATAIDFHDRSEGNVTAWFWDFGEGVTSQEQNPTYIFNHPLPGTMVKINPYRTVSLTILTSDGCKSLYSEVINIMDGTPYQPSVCMARYKYYQMAYDSIGGTASFQLTNLSEGDSLTYLWQFDNGKTSTEYEPTVTFDTKQTENKVCLTVTGKNNITDTFCDAVYIDNPDKPIIYPAECKTQFKYSVNYDIKTFAPALVLDFHSDTYPEAVEWKWDFDDGTSSDEANPTHIFNFPLATDNVLADPNPFRKVCLSVKTASGCMATWCETINIYLENVNPVVEPELTCHAWFKYYKPLDVISVPEVVPYKLVDVSEGKVIRRLWQLEDGTTSTDQEPLVSFDFRKPTQKVCLTIYTADSCMSTWCETIYVTNEFPDTIKTSEWNYTMKYTSSFPIQMSSCAGYAKAQVYLKDSLINATDYSWSNGVLGQETKGLCPTQSYSVKAKTPDGTIVSGTFIFNSDGTVTETPINWWVSGVRDNPLIQYRISDMNYTVEWRLCDGTIVKSDSIPFNSINCGTNDSNLILKDAAGNVIYTENISMKTIATYFNPELTLPSVKFYPNPVTDVLNINYSGNALNEIKVEICDVSGKTISVQKFNQVESGQTLSLNVNSLVKGIYVCRMISGKKILGAEKFVK